MRIASLSLLLIGLLVAGGLSGVLEIAAATPQGDNKNLPDPATFPKGSTGDPAAMQATGRVELFGKWYAKDEFTQAKRAYAAYRNAGARALKKGKAAEAIRLFDIALSLAPDDAPVLTTVGTLWFNQRDAKKARPYYERAVKAAPESSVHRTRLGRCLLELRDFAALETLLTESLTRHPFNTNYYVLRSNAAIIQNKPKAQKAAEAKIAEILTGELDTLLGTRRRTGVPLTFTLADRPYRAGSREFESTPLDLADGAPKLATAKPPSTRSWTRFQKRWLGAKDLRLDLKDLAAQGYTYDFTACRARELSGKAMLLSVTVAGKPTPFSGTVRLTFLEITKPKYDAQSKLIAGKLEPVGGAARVVTDDDFVKGNRLLMPYCYTGYVRLDVKFADGGTTGTTHQGFAR